MTDGLPRSRSVGLSAASAIHTQRNGDDAGKKKRPVRPSNRPALSSMHAPYTTYTRERGELLQRCSRCADRMLLSLGGRVQRRESERGGKRREAGGCSEPVRREPRSTRRVTHTLSRPGARASSLAASKALPPRGWREGGRETEGRPLPCTAWPHKRLGHPSARRGRPASQTDNGLLSF